MWHVSIARLKSNGTPMNLAEWGHGVYLAGRRAAEDCLRGVGEGESVEMRKPDYAALHVRRALSASEIALLSAEWLAIPAVDEFTEAGGLEEKL